MKKVFGIVALLLFVLSVTASSQESIPGTVYTVSGVRIIARDTLRVGGVFVNNGTSTITGKVVVTDTVRVTGDVDLNAKLDVLGNVTFSACFLTGNAKISGTSTFATTTVVKSIYIAGLLATDFVHVTPLAPASTTAPVAGDLCNAIAKTDTLIILRAAGTTSGMGFNYLIIR